MECVKKKSRSVYVERRKKRWRKGTVSVSTCEALLEVIHKPALVRIQGHGPQKNGSGSGLGGQ
jgi:hypothetical protein